MAALEISLPCAAYMQNRHVYRENWLIIKDSLHYTGLMACPRFCHQNLPPPHYILSASLVGMTMGD